MVHVVVKNKLILKIIGKVFNMETTAVTLWPFILCTNPMEDTVLNHELIHIKQYEELGIIGFYIIFPINFLINLIRYRDRFVAYQNVKFEREAFKYMDNLDYLKTRKFYSWVKL